MSSPPEKYLDLDLVGFLYNTSYGGFAFSKEFLEAVSKRDGVPRLKGWEWRQETRWDPSVISTFLELGSKASSGDFAKLEIKWIPRSMLDYVEIDEYDGKETVGVNFMAIAKYLLEDFLVDWRRDTSLTVGVLDKRYREMKEKEKRYLDFTKGVVSH
jgi:hypothetical protein